MIRVTVQLISAISRDRDRTLGVLDICNVGGSLTKGDYECKFPSKTVRVTEYPRKAVSIWNLLYAACLEAGYIRCK